MIASQLQAKADELGAQVKLIDALLDEVTALVEWPVVVSEFEAEYLEVPQECLILTMQANQKYFPAVQRRRQAAEPLPDRLQHGGGRPDQHRHRQRPRRPPAPPGRPLSSIRTAKTLASRLDKLGNVVYHNKLGSVLRGRAPSTRWPAGSPQPGADAVLAARAARWPRPTSLPTWSASSPELQGIMGRYYALHDGESADVADAIQSHYQPRFARRCAAAGATSPAPPRWPTNSTRWPASSASARCRPATRIRSARAAPGALRILMESPLPLDLGALIDDALAGFATGTLTAPDCGAQLHDFMLDRLRGYLRDAGHANDIVEAVLAQRPTRIDQVPARLDAVRQFVAHDARWRWPRPTSGSATS